MYITNSDKAIEIYKIITEKEAEKKGKRKKRRLKDKIKDEDEEMLVENFKVDEYASNFLNRFTHHATQHF